MPWGSGSKWSHAESSIVETDGYYSYKNDYSRFLVTEKTAVFY